jgi:cysteinyl-tRNA synthetase
MWWVALTVPAVSAAGCGGDDCGCTDDATAEDAVAETAGDDAADTGTDVGVEDGAADDDGGEETDAACGDRSGIRAVDDWVYQLQEISPAAIGATRFDLVVMDYSSDGVDSGAFTPAELETIRNGPSERKIVLSYLSIGEAEDYRRYWEAGWHPGSPAWLAEENPDWAGNYKVRFWDPAWQAIVFDYLDRIVAAGFDGVYLDIIDGYEYWEDRGRDTARADMAAFVAAIAARGRAAAGCRPFYVVPQNAPAVSAEPGYLDVVDAIGVEDTFYNDDDPQDPADTAAVMSELATWLAADKVVLSVDYVTTVPNIGSFYTLATAARYAPYATVRELDALTINAGHEPD